MAFKLLIIESSLNHIMCQQFITKHNFIYLMSKVQVSCIPLAFLRLLLYVKQKQGPTLERKKKKHDNFRIYDIQRTITPKVIIRVLITNTANMVSLLLSTLSLVPEKLMFV